MCPYNPDGRWRGGRIRRRLLYIYASDCRVDKVSAMFNMYISRCVIIFIYIYIYIYIIHMVISACGVFVNTYHDRSMIFPGSALRGVNRCGRPKQETSCCGDQSDIGCWRSRSCCVTLYLATFVGRGTDWQSEHAWLSVERSWDVTNMLRRASQTPKKRIYHILS